MRGVLDVGGETGGGATLPLSGSVGTPFPNGDDAELEGR
jgi:hypothetical protein